MPKKRPTRQRSAAAGPAKAAQTAASPPSVQPNGRRWLLWGNVAAILLVAVLMRVASLGNIPGLNGDEAWMGVQAMNYLRGLEFSGRTPTGNPLNWFLFLPELALHAWPPPSVALLRWPAAASGLLALVANFFWCRAVFGRRMAWISTVLLAVLPVNIAYSRFAWDSCQTLLATSMAIYPALYAVCVPQRRARWLLISCLGLLASLLVHPTNIFIVPLLAMAVVFSCRAELLDWWRAGSQGSRKQAVLSGAALALGGALLVLAYWNPSSPGPAKRLQVVRQNLTSTQSLRLFVKYFPRLFTGVTVYQYIPGSCGDRYSLFVLTRDRDNDVAPNPPPRLDPQGCLGHDLAGVAIFLLAGVAIARRIIRRREPLDLCLLCGWCLTLLGFFLVTKPGEGILPHFERYAICLVLPTSLLLSLAADWLLGGREADGRTTAQPNSPTGTSQASPTVMALLLAVAWLWLASCGWYYFRFIQQTGGESHRAFRTAAIEPKAAAYQRILARRTPGEPIWIVSAEWWAWMPLAYISAGDNTVHTARIPDLLQQPDARSDAALAEGRLYLVEFLDAQNYSLARQWLGDQASGPIDEEFISDDQGRPILAILHAAAKPADAGPQ